MPNQELRQLRASPAEFAMETALGTVVGLEIQTVLPVLI